MLFQFVPVFSGYLEIRLLGEDLDDVHGGTVAGYCQPGVCPRFWRVIRRQTEAKGMIFIVGGPQQRNWQGA
jgi:hypothetical protein